jgi:DNA-directed RNA polymerase III subunit RPC5
MARVRIKIEDDDPVDKTEECHEPMQVEDEMDDPLVREIDVYLSPALAHQMYLLQYPLQPADNPQNAGSTTSDTISAVRIKRRHGLLEIDHPLPQNLVLGTEPLAHRTFSSQTIPVQTHLCLGKLVTDSANGTKSALHLVPLHNIRQMRPSFRHIDNHDNNIGQQQQQLDQNRTADYDYDEEEEEEQAAAIAALDKKPLVFQRKESERAAMARKSSWAYKKSSQDAEEWHDLLVIQNDAHQRDAIVTTKVVQLSQPRETCLLQSPDSPGTNLDAAYIQSLNYLPPSGRDDPMNIQYTGSDIKSVTARLTSLMRQGCPIPFQILQDKFLDDATAIAVDEVKLLSALSVCAWNVRGNYCLNSRFLPNLSEPVKRGRAFILLLLQHRGFVQRQQLMKVFSSSDNDRFATLLSADTVLVLLQQVAKKIKGGWTLKIMDDKDHLMRFPENQRLHEDYWERQAERYNDTIALYDS